MFGAISEKNFVLLTCRLFLQFPEFFTFDGRGGGFSIIRRFYYIINLLVNGAEHS